MYFGLKFSALRKIACVGLLIILSFSAASAAEPARKNHWADLINTFGFAQEEEELIDIIRNIPTQEGGLYAMVLSKLAETDDDYILLYSREWGDEAAAFFSSAVLVIFRDDGQCEYFQRSHPERERIESDGARTFGPCDKRQIIAGQLGLNELSTKAALNFGEENTGIVSNVLAPRAYALEIRHSGQSLYRFGDEMTYMGLPLASGSNEYFYKAVRLLL